MAASVLNSGYLGGIGSDNLIGAAPTLGSGTPWGQVPQVPNPITSGNLAITGDIGNLPSLTDLASQVNQFNTGQAIAPYIANLPGYQGMVAQSSQNIGNLLQGNVPPDVLRLLQQQAAERGVGRGISGSPNEMAAYLQALGLTSLGLQHQGEGELTQAIGRTPTAPMFNVANFLTTPNEEQAARMAANMYSAAPDPGLQAQALMDLFRQFQQSFSGGGGFGLGGTPSLGTHGPQLPNATYPPATVSSGGGGAGGPPSQGYAPPSSVQSFPSGQFTPNNTGGYPGGGPPPGTGYNPFTDQSYNAPWTLGAGSGTSPWTLGGTSPNIPGWNQTLFGGTQYQDSNILGMGLDPALNALFGTAPSPYAPPPGTGYDPFMDQSYNAPWMTGGSFGDQFGQFATGAPYTEPGTSYDPYTDSSYSSPWTMPETTPSWSDFEDQYFNQFLEGP